MTLTLLIPGATAAPTLPPDIQALLIGPSVPPPDGRIHSLRLRGTLTDLINHGLSHISTDHALILLPSDTLEPSSLPALTRAASTPGVSGAVGHYRFTSPIGDLPVLNSADASSHAVPPSTLTYDDFLINSPPSCSVLLSRRAISDLRLSSPHPEAELLLRLAERGHRFATTPTLIARRHLSPLAEIETTLRDLASRIRLLADSLARTGRDAELPTLASDLIDAVIVLRAHQRTIADRGTSHLATATRFPSLFSQWWHRCGLLGPAPRHILTANGGVAEAISTDPALIAKRLLSLCPRGKPPILLGLGRNARVIARALHSAGIPVIGRDDSAPPAPAWSIDDNIPIQLIARSEPFDPAATYLMTVLHDDAFLARLPQLRILRWREMPELILAEWRASALQWATRTNIPEPKPALVGAAP